MSLNTTVVWFVYLASYCGGFFYKLQAGDLLSIQVLVIVFSPSCQCLDSNSLGQSCFLSHNLQFIIWWSCLSCWDHEIMIKQTEKIRSVLSWSPVFLMLHVLCRWCWALSVSKNFCYINTAILFPVWNQGRIQLCFPKSCARCTTPYATTRIQKVGNWASSSSNFRPNL